MRLFKPIFSWSPQFGLGFAVVALVGGCGTEGTEPPVPAAIAISPHSATLIWFNESIQLTATVQDLDGQAISGVTVTWTSGDESVVTVDATGLVTAVGKGVAPVRAAAEGMEALSTVTVDLQRGALLKIYETLGGPGWDYNRNWGTDEPIQSWWGVTTDTAGNVVELRLSRNQLTGRIPTEMVVLETLGFLDLGWNNLTGPIPPELGKLQRLGFLDLNGNELTGPIPPELGNLQELWSLALDRNELTGPIPPELGDLPGLNRVNLSGNALTGPIPPVLGNIQSLRELALDYNELTGPVPPEFGNLEELEYLAIDNTLLTGRLPRELIGLRRLGRFYWHETDLCSPPDEEFQEWLASIRGRRGNGKCGS